MILVCQVKCHHPLCEIFKFWLSSLHRHAGQISVRLRPLRTGIQTGLCKLPGHFLQNTPFYIYICIYIYIPQEFCKLTCSMLFYNRDVIVKNMCNWWMETSANRNLCLYPTPAAACLYRWSFELTVVGLLLQFY